jgi:hypothetical protein
MSFLYAPSYSSDEEWVEGQPHDVKMFNIGVPLHTPNNVANNNDVELNIQMGRTFNDV